MDPRERLAAHADQAVDPAAEVGSPAVVLRAPPRQPVADLGKSISSTHG
jgi:hypothetical protein